MQDSTGASAFDGLVRAYSAPLLRYLTRQVGDPGIAEDLSQETWLKVRAGLAGFESRSELKTWIFAIATNVARDYLRRPAQRLRIVPIDEAATEVDDAKQADERLVIDEMNQCVRDVIDSLPADYRAALILHDLEGMSGQQTAVILGCSLAAGKVRVHRARARLKRALESQCSFYRDEKSAFRCTPK